MKSLLNNLLRILHFSSLDVVFGAMAYQAYFYYLLNHQRIPMAFSMGLFCSIWIIYLVDRKWDAYLGQSPDQRHLYQRKNAFFINILIFFLIIVLGFTMVQFPFWLIKKGFFLGLGIGIYWLLVPLFNRIRFPFLKEFFTAFIYSLGIFFCTEKLFNMDNSKGLFLLFFLMVFHHLLLYDSLEKSHPKKWFSQIILLVEGIWLGLFFSLLYFKRISLLEISPMFLTMGLQVFIHYFFYQVKSRFLAELAYLSPIVLFFYEIFTAS